MPNITWCDLPEDVSLWPGLPLSLSGDEVINLLLHKHDQQYLQVR